MPKVGVVVGTRPEVVKLAPVVAEMKRTGQLEPVVISTRQQRDLLPSTLTDLGVCVDFELALPPFASITDHLAQTIAGTGALLRSVALDAIIVQGDTATSLGAAQAAFYAGVPVVHVEAGLRSGNRLAPFPEEANRRAISVVADLHLAPTAAAAENLRAEGIALASIVVTGNTVVDTLLAFAGEDSVADEWLDALVAAGRRIVVLTMHRRESWGEPMRAVAEAVADVLARRGGDTIVVVPAHPNPVVREALGPLVDEPNAMVIEPLPYRRFLRLLSVANVVLTDSGGVQEEAPSFGVPVLVLREVTERTEGVRSGVAELVGTDPGNVSRSLWAALDRPRHPGGGTANPYGDGRASQRCVQAIVELLAAGRPQAELSRSTRDGATTLR